MAREAIQVLEKGDIYFFFRPANTADEVKGLPDVRRFYMLLDPDERDELREIVVGKKKLPDVEQGERFFAFVDRIYKDPEEAQAGLEGEGNEKPARAAGEGRYALAQHNSHTHLAYSLELPQETGEVQHEFRIENEGGYVVSVRNPETGDFLSDGKPSYPEEVRQMFDPDNRFARTLNPSMLDYEHAEFILIGEKDDPVSELGIEFDTQEESITQSNLVQELKLEQGKKRLKPVEEGKWE